MEQREMTMYTLEDDDEGVWKCSQCDVKWLLISGTPADNEMCYCPKCGRKMEIKEVTCND